MPFYGQNTRLKPQFAQIAAQSQCATPTRDLQKTLSPHCNALCSLSFSLFPSLAVHAGNGNKNCLLFNFICSISDKQHVNLLELTQQQQGEQHSLQMLLRQQN